MLLRVVKRCRMVDGLLRVAEGCGTLLKNTVRGFESSNGLQGLLRVWELFRGFSIAVGHGGLRGWK